jgi:hypothetical protein
MLDPYPALARLRDDEPVHWSASHDAWIVTSYERCAEVLYDASRFTSASPGREYHSQQPRPLVAMDAPDHHRLREFAASALAPRAVEAAADRLRRLVASMVDALPHGRPFDLIEALATPLPERAILAYTGVETAIDPNEARLLTRPSGDASADGVKRASVSMLNAIRGDAVDGSLVSAIAGGLDRGQLNEVEATHLLADVLSAGADATSYAIANAVLALVEHPEAYRAIGAAYSVETAVEELLRFDNSTQAAARFASEATRLGSARIARDDQLFVMVAAANRDPAAFEEPERLDLGRSPNRHLAFALGAHYCLGASLAREILRETMGQLRSRFATLSLGPSGGERRGNFALRGFSRLEVVGTGPVLSPA